MVWDCDGKILTKLSADHRLYFRFRTITVVDINGFLPNFVCALILCRSGLGLLFFVNF